MNDLSGKNILVTGAGGFIGSAMVRTLVGFKANVVSLVRSHSDTTQLEGSTVHVGDVADYKFMCDIISMHEIEYIFHFAANAIVRIAAKDPMNCYQSNVIGTVSILEAARNVGKCKKILVSSSDKAYGDHEKLPYTEDMALQPKNTYDTSKACADLVARSYAHNYNMPIIVTRCSNVYGPGDPNMSRIIPNSINRALQGNSPELYSDVSQMEREFIYIDDVIDACLLLIFSDNNTNGEAFNIGGSGPESVENVVDKILSLMNSPLKTTIKDRDPTFKEIKRQYIDASKLNKFTGWVPKVNLNLGLLRTISWYKERFS